MHDISLTGLLIGYVLLLFPIGIILWLRVPMLGTLGWALLRMTVQLLLVGLYLQFIFRLDHAAVNIAWLLIMVGVADASVLSGSGLRLRRLGGAVFVAVLVGTLLPVLVFTGGILRLPRLIEAQYLIPIAGMVLGNCLRADIIGLRTFYGTMRKQRRTCEQYLTQGASPHEMASPWFREALEASLAPTVATMATVGLVSLPGIMTDDEPPVHWTWSSNSKRRCKWILIRVRTRTRLRFLSGEGEPECGPDKPPHVESRFWRRGRRLRFRWWRCCGSSSSPSRSFKPSPSCTANACAWAWPP